MTLPLLWLIFYNSFQTSLLVSLRSDNAWLAALYFGDYPMAMATAVAWSASTIGMSLNYFMSYYLSRYRDELPSYSEKRYQKIVDLFDRRLFLLMLIPPIPVLEGIPGISFMPFFVLVCGLFRVPPKQAICAIALGRALFYGFYLTP